jgi:hypothetical protein
MENGVLETHKSADAGRPLDERLSSAIDSNGVSLLYVGRRRSAAGREDFDGEMTTSLKEMASRLTEEELSELLADTGMEDLAEKSKDELVDLYYDSNFPKTAEDCIIDVLPYGGAMVEHLRSLIAEGGRREVGKDKVRSGEETLTSIFPDILLFDGDETYVEQVPQEIVDLLKEINDLQLNILSVKTGITIGQLTALLFQLEMKGVVKPLAGGMYHLLL